LEYQKEKKKKRAHFGEISSTTIFDKDLVGGETGSKPALDAKSIEESQKEKKTWKERIIIAHDSKWKAIFDVFILLLVGYSCVKTVYYLAFEPKKDDNGFNLNLIGEYLFGLDLILNFLQSYKDPEIA
jgi:hypothetical protein